MRNVARFIIFLLVGLVVAGLTLSTADAGTNIIEFKEKKVINSPKVCGDRLCDEPEVDYSEQKNRHTPMGQYELGIPIYKITCKPHLTFVLKASNWHPACVWPDTAQKLVDLGWAANPEDLNNIFAASIPKESPQFAPLDEFREVYPLVEGVGIEIFTEKISGEWYLVFDGYGWHRLHNVEITISNDSGPVEFLMSQTDPRGFLYLPWKIPDTITSGMYHISATDGINEYEINIPITSIN